ncbi:MAG: NAD-dependent deacylase [Alicyclobacillus macrosporangiidus]|uniref:SIR2 family NAD-dependent protein deacylase n=1 Tax=Alicyclobacillus macrosporangiidus TaxID=392015 RepID=UPI0026EB2B4D|nr:NAD-dependent deacylase [Alicyclobacillus macrosporangiidus]MCL6601002.1 NAD-dependent deacylase [Alicyclobacillus macrosporangiidus]
MTLETVKTLADWIQAASSTVVLTGAGISTESGVPDFRSKSGWWRNVDPATVATADALQHNYPLFHAFYRARIEALKGLSPNVGHQILAKWEAAGRVDAIATQNVDGFHQMAGSRRVYELHGSIRSARCSNCGASASVEDFVAQRSCPHCGGRLRPNVVLFDETLPQDAWQGALEAIARADLVLVVGTSLNVSPANTLPALTRGKTAVINLEPTRMDEAFDLVIHGKAGEVLAAVDGRMG